MATQGLIALEAAQEQMMQCMKCGNCQAVCPLYAETMHEGAVARGKIRLAVDVLEGKLAPSHELLDKFALCLTCKACEANCPCDVRCVDIILAARAALTEKVGLPLIKRSIYRGLKLRRMFNFGLKVGAQLQGLAMKRVDLGNQGKFRSLRLPLAGIDMRRVIPELATTPLRDLYDEFIPAYGGKAKRRVGFFTGCVMNLIYTDTGRAIIEVLRANDCDVIMPKEQHCCGAPVFIGGERAIGRDMARHNLDVFTAMDQKYHLDHIVFACGTCVTSFAESYKELLSDDPPYRAKAETLAAKSIDANALVVTIGGLAKKLAPIPRKVTYHDSCHLARSVHVTEPPRQILRSIPGVELIEMKDAARCCGGAGSFSLTHYPLSQQITSKKAENIAATGAETVTTGCPGCRMTIEDGLAQAGLRQDTVHPLALLQESYQKAGILKKS
ncbi:(Fe-S)-binding protein [Heliophilum fasciatum]|uniref:Glycolate oxidase iron-sulfur subunit n=1 Tax=Heliophilum fasciatum TaxID=35700 RepID=A0A4V2SXT3_9FIRM|nr:(Fe-S)-binding protein [Heliophilum fasciatum]MCW2277390.1 glycolate oxidase iron-sulfur subunit [Heliophilum fasciatum]TCP67226.1 glycolate oxidase iron-sulfur subunit [Heliophilum fasciatum]